MRVDGRVCVFLLTACAQSAGGTGSARDGGARLDAVTRDDASLPDDIAARNSSVLARDVDRSDLGAQRFDVNGALSDRLRLIAPLATSTVTSTRPTLEWVRPTGAARTRIEICRDRLCEQREELIDTAESSVRPQSPLTAGVHFWRVRTVTADGGLTASSAVWWFRSPRADTGTDTSHGVAFDYNGDGYGDLGVARSTSLAPRAIVPMVMLGGPGGLSADPQRILDVGTEVRIAPAGDRFPKDVERPEYVHVGDVNGDGFSDAIVRAGFAETTSALHLILGSSDRVVRQVPLVEIFADRMWREVRASFAGDINHDGFADIALMFRLPEGGRRVGFLLGSPSEPVLIDYHLDPGPRSSNTQEIWSIYAGDTDADRSSELLLYSAPELDSTGPILGTSFAIFSLTPAGPARREILSSQNYYSTDMLIPGAFATACDLNGDGRSDVVHSGSTVFFRRPQPPFAIAFVSSAAGLSASNYSAWIACNSSSETNVSSLLEFSGVAFGTRSDSGIFRPAYMLDGIGYGRGSTWVSVGNDYDQNGLGDVAGLKYVDMSTIAFVSLQQVDGWRSTTMTLPFEPALVAP